jgi:hypothetical protein
MIETSLEKIFLDIFNTAKEINSHTDYPHTGGIYGLFLASSTLFQLTELIQKNTLLYLGISENLYIRDYNEHFESGKTGSSSVRRALGAILKDELKLKAIPRGSLEDFLKRKKYKFTQEGELVLTSWMLENLKIGYWKAPQGWTKKLLKDRETQLTIELKPVLDRDPRTKRFNPYAPFIDSVAAICIGEAETIAVSNDRN